jgi:uncharacterized membrane protein
MFRYNPKLRSLRTVQSDMICRGYMTTAPVSRHRLESIDWLRGFVMIIMTLDHTRDYFAVSGLNPMTDPAIPVPLFITRWITHICAPAFVLLAGVSAGLIARRKTRTELSWYLLTRGLWLIFLEATVITFAWKFNLVNSPAVILQIMWAIGVAMVFLSGLIYLPRYVVLCLGIIIVAGGNLFDGLLPMSEYPNADPLWLGIHRQIMWIPAGIQVDVYYPVLSWSGLMACGYGLAAIYDWKPGRRQQFLFGLGGGLLVLFILLRWLNLYGDPHSWQAGASFKHSIISFMNLEKYPPSLLFIAVTLGLTLPLLSLVERCRSPLHDAIVTIGRVPLFYYVVHLYIVHLLAMVGGVIQGFPASAWLVDIVEKPEGYGFGLPVIYMVWVSLVLALYPACRWFAGMKAKRSDWWLSYL